MKPKCCICEKDAKITIGQHWRTGMPIELTEGTCGSPKCVKEYEKGMEEGLRLAEEENEINLAILELENFNAN